MTLAEALAGAAAELPRAQRRDTNDSTEWLVDDRVFAVLTGPVAEFLLEPTIGRAALGTPDTSSSPRGADWVSFAPPELDRFAIDRATAWLASAYRHAVGGRR